MKALTPRLQMSLLELDTEETSTTTKNRKEKAVTDLLKEETKASNATKSLLPPLPSRIGKVEKSKVLERAAAFLPQLASANKQLSSLPAEAVNIENLTGNEQQVIEMKLGLGVFEQKDEKDSLEQEKAKQIITGKTQQASDSDRFDAFVQQLLTFNDSDDDDPVQLYTATSTTDDDSEMEFLEFE